MTDREYEVMERYLRGEFVRDEDEYIIDKFANIEYVKLGFDYDEKGIVRDTAILTPLGREVFYEERRMWSVVRSLLHFIFPI